MVDINTFRNMKFLFKNSIQRLSCVLFLCSLFAETWTYGISDRAIKTLSSFDSLISGGGVLIPLVILHLSSVVRCSSPPTVMIPPGSKSNDTKNRQRSAKSSRGPRFIKELTMMNRQSCLSKILCGVEVSQPPSTSSSTINDYAYLVKSFFDQLSIQSAVKNSINFDAADNEEEEEESDTGDAYQYKKITDTSKKDKPRYPTYSEVFDSFHDEELDALNKMPLEDILNDDSLLDFKKRRGKMNPKNMSELSTKETIVANVTHPSSRRNSRFQSASRGYLGYVNPRFDKTAFLNKKQLELGKAMTGNDKLAIAAEIAAKMRSPRQCRLLGWLSPSYTTTTTITTTSNTPPGGGNAAGVATSTCPFTVSELQKLIVSSQHKVAGTSAPSLANLKLKMPIGKPIKKLVTTPAPTTTSTTQNPAQSFADYFDDEKVVGPLEIIPELGGSVPFVQPEDDEKDWYQSQGNIFPSVPVPTTFKQKPKWTPKPQSSRDRLRPAPRPTESTYPKEYHHRPPPINHRPSINHHPPSMNYPPSLNHAPSMNQAPSVNRPPSGNRPPMRYPTPFNYPDLNSRPIPGQFGLLSYKPTPDPKLAWTTTTASPWDEIAFNDHVDQYAYKGPEYPGRPPMNSGFPPKFDYSRMEGENSEESSGEDNSEEVSRQDRPPHQDHISMETKGRLDFGSEKENDPNNEDNDSNEDSENPKSRSKTRNSSKETKKSKEQKSSEDSNESDEKPQHVENGGNDDNDSKEDTVNSNSRTKVRESSKETKTSINGQKSVEESNESDEEPQLEENGGNDDEKDSNENPVSPKGKNKPRKSSKETYKSNGQKSGEQSDESEENLKRDEHDDELVNANNNLSKEKVKNIGNFFRTSSLELEIGNGPTSTENSEESDEIPKLDDEDDSDGPGGDRSNESSQNKPSGSKDNNKSKDQESEEESQESEEHKKAARKNVKQANLNRNITETSTKKPGSKIPHLSLPKPGVLTSLLSDHGRRTLSRISSLFNYGSKAEIREQVPPSSPPKPFQVKKKPRKPKKSIKKQTKRKRPFKRNPNIDYSTDSYEAPPRPSRPHIRHPPITPILIEDGHSWENEEKPKEDDAEEFFDKDDNFKPTDKPEKYDYDDLESGESSEETTNIKNGVDFGPGQKMNTEYSDITSGDRLVGQDRYVSGLPTSWETLYKEMMEKKKKNTNSKPKDKESEEVNDDENSEESEEDDDDRDSRNRRRPMYSMPMID